MINSSSQSRDLDSGISQHSPRYPSRRHDAIETLRIWTGYILPCTRFWNQLVPQHVMSGTDEPPCSTHFRNHLPGPFARLIMWAGSQWSLLYCQINPQKCSKSGVLDAAQYSLNNLELRDDILGGKIDREAPKPPLARMPTRCWLPRQLPWFLPGCVRRGVHRLVSADVPLAIYVPC